MKTIVPIIALVVAATTLLSNADAQSFANFGQPCAPFRCSSRRQVVVPKRDFEYTANGCGTAQLPITTDVDFTDCCNWHDACYSTCGMNKSVCEKRLDKCMKRQCSTLSNADAKRSCTSTAQLFSIGAQMIACPAFQDAQRAACDCVAPSDVAAATRARLEHFLATSDASAVDRTTAAVDALLAKYAGGQEPTMFLRLLRKYPHALRTDPLKRNYMDDIFKSASGETAASVREDEALRDVAVDEHVEL